MRPSPLEKLLELKPSALERVSVRQIMTVDEKDDKDQVRVLARWNNPARSPAVAERVVGEGRVLLWTTTADRAGNDWPIEPSFVLAVREAVRGTARPTRFDNTVTAGERDAARRLLEPAGLQRPLDSARAAASRGRCRSSRWAESPAIAARRSRSTSPIRACRGRTVSPGTKVPWGRSKICTRPIPIRAKARWSGSRCPS